MKKIKHHFKDLSLIFAGVFTLILLPIIAADLLYQTEIVFKRGFIVEVLEGGAKKKEEAPIDIRQLIASADLKKGELTAKKCSSCHTFNKGEANRVGPNLYAIVNRKKAAVSGFAYSDAMKSKGGNWDIESINQFITKPKDYIPGTKMGFAGLKKPQDRANVIAYLQSLK